MFKIKPENIDRDIKKLEQLELELSEMDIRALRAEDDRLTNSYARARTAYEDKYGEYKYDWEIGDASPDEQRDWKAVEEMRSEMMNVSNQVTKYERMQKEAEKIRRMLDEEVISLKLNVHRSEK